MFLFFTKTSYLLTAKITPDVTNSLWYLYAVEEPGDLGKYLEPCKTSKMERFSKIVNNF